MNRCGVVEGEEYRSRVRGRWRDKGVNRGMRGVLPTFDDLPSASAPPCHTV